MLFSYILLSGYAAGLAFTAPNLISKYNTSQPAEVSAPGDVLDEYIVVMKRWLALPISLNSTSFFCIMCSNPGIWRSWFNVASSELSEDAFNRHLAGVLPASIAAKTKEYVLKINSCHKLEDEHWFHVRKFSIGGFKAYSGPFPGSVIRKIQASSDVSALQAPSRFLESHICASTGLPLNHQGPMICIHGFNSIRLRLSKKIPKYNYTV